MSARALSVGLSVLAVVGAFAAGLAVGRSGGADDADLREQLDAAQTAMAQLETERDEALERAAAARRDRARAGASATASYGGLDSEAVVPEGSPSASTGGDPEAVPEPTADERAARVSELRADFAVWLDRGDGESAIAALRELAALAPEGREAAMELALIINDDVNGLGKLRLSDVQFYGGLADPGIKQLMDWALVRDDTPSAFRVMSAYSLPWTQSQEATLAQFGAALESESDLQVQRALVSNLGRLRAPEAERLLGEILRDDARDAGLRASVVGELALTTDDALAQWIADAAREDAAPEVRDAARAALVARDPPARGYLVTGTLPTMQAEAAGMRAGDIVVSYGGTPTPTPEALRGASTAREGDEQVSVIVVRDGEEIELVLRPGRLGVFGRGVEPAPR